MKSLLLRWTFLLLFAVAGTALAQTGVSIKQLDDRLRVEIDGKLFTEYHFKGASRPYLYPIIGPGGAAMTRDYPMKKTGNETEDHPHHRSLFYGHGAMNGGHNFWGEHPPGATGSTLHVRFDEVKGGANVGIIRAHNRLESKGQVIGTDDRTIRIHRTPHGPMIDFEITHHASHGELVFEDTKEGTMAIRVAETMVLRHPRTGRYASQRPDEGHIVNSEGHRDVDTWGKRATWVDYYGPVNGKTVGIAMFDHPSNPRHPTWWHVRDYGLFAANPFGVHDFERLENPAAGEFKVPSGKSATFKYRFFFHAGDEKAGKVAERYKEYAVTK